MTVQCVPVLQDTEETHKLAVSEVNVSKIASVHLIKPAMITTADPPVIELVVKILNVRQETTELSVPVPLAMWEIH